MQMNVDYFLETLENLRCLKEQEISQMSSQVIQIFVEESNVVQVTTPIIICGNLNGQFFELLQILQLGGQVSKQKYIFLGGYCTKGRQNIETFCYLCCLKIKYPNQITLLRGKYESELMAYNYGLYEEVQQKYSCNNVWKYLCNIFQYLPLAALIEEKIFCVFGGLSPDIQTIDDIRTLDRRQEIPEEGPLTDLMWSNPDLIDDWQQSPSGAGYLFGEKIVKVFNHRNSLDLIVKSNQLEVEGYKYWFDKQLLTIWSSPNHCYRMGNPGAFLELQQDFYRKIHLFHHSKQINDLQIGKVFPRIF